MPTPLPAPPSPSPSFPLAVTGNPSFRTLSSPTFLIGDPSSYRIAGVRSGGRVPFVSAKGAKTISAVAWPCGCPARFAASRGAQTRYAQTVRALSPESAALLGQATRPGSLVKERTNQLKRFNQGPRDDSRVGQ